jgi:hypothetical protein
MELKNRIFPYPIYSSIQEESDYSSKPFEVSINMENDSKNGLLKLIINWKVHEKALEYEIAEDRVCFALHIECPSTTFYSLIKTRDSSFSIELKLSDLNQTVQIVSMLIASKPIENYGSSNLLGLFQGQSYFFERGNIIGIGDSYKINVKKDVDKFKQIKSLFEINMHSGQNKQIFYHISTDTSKVHIFIPREDYDYYESAGQNPSLKSTLDSLFIVPVLSELLTRIKYDESLNFEDIWVEAVLKAYQRVSKSEINVENRSEIEPVVDCQKIYNDPLINSFEYILKVGQERQNGDE